MASTVAAVAGAGTACSSEEAPASTLPAHCSNTPAGEVPDDLACTGLYADLGAKVVAKTAMAYTPATPLWSDGYDKDRWIELPSGTKIDATDVDDWRFPVGTKAWKEFRLGDRKIETRFFWKVGDDKWLQAAYVWSEDGKQAMRGEGSDLQVGGKPYHVPKAQDCNSCHRGRKDRILGFEAVSLAQPAASGFTLERLVDEQRIEPAPVQKTIALFDPGLGVLHANCGISCHNGTSGSTAYSTKLRLRLAFDDIANNKPIAEWESYQTLIGVQATMPGWAGEVRVVPGDPDKSLVITVMRLRGQGQMPPIGTNVVDEEGLGAVEGWIRSLSGAPAGKDGDSATPDPKQPVTPSPQPPPGTPAPLPITATCDDGGFKEVEANDTEAAASAIGTAVKFCGEISSATDHDYFTFTMPANAKTFRFDRAYSATTGPTVTWTAEGQTTSGAAPAPFFPGKRYVVHVSSPTPVKYGIVMTIGK